MSTDKRDVEVTQMIWQKAKHDRLHHRGTEQVGR